MVFLLSLFACFSTANPCDDYCSYICDCHAGEADYNCDECYTTYDGAEASLQDECETSLIDLQNQDEAEGHTCTSGSGTTGGTTTP